MPIEEQLQEGERVLASYDLFWATNHRLLRYEVSGQRERMEVLEYLQISSLERRTRRRRQTILLGLLVMFLAVAVAPAGMGRFLFVLPGLTGVLFGLVNRTVYVEFRSPGLRPREQARWRIRNVQQEAALELLESVRARLNGALLDTPSAPVSAETRVAPPRRSVLMLPADRPDQLPPALNLHPDSLCLDLGSTVDATQRELARQLLWGEVTAASKSYAEVLVRLGSAEATDDLEACVWPGISGVIATVESAEEVRQLDMTLQVLERTRGLPAPVRLLVFLETPHALGAMQEIVAASLRVEAVVLGGVDLTPSSTGFTSPMEALGNAAGPISAEFYHEAVLRAIETGVQLLGVLGANIPPGHLHEAFGRPEDEALLSAAQEAYRRGFQGALTPHPQGVAACNKGFGTPNVATEEIH